MFGITFLWPNFGVDHGISLVPYGAFSPSYIAQSLMWNLFKEKHNSQCHHY
jgi:hypothetical protein